MILCGLLWVAAMKPFEGKRASAAFPRVAVRRRRVKAYGCSLLVTDPLGMAKERLEVTSVKTEVVGKPRILRSSDGWVGLFGKRRMRKVECQSRASDLPSESEDGAFASWLKRPRILKASRHAQRMARYRPKALLRSIVSSGRRGRNRWDCPIRHHHGDESASHSPDRPGRPDCQLLVDADTLWTRRSNVMDALRV